MKTSRKLVMKMRKWSVSAGIITSLIFLTSCLNGGTNSQTFDGVPAYVDFDGGNIVMKNLTYYSPLSVPSNLIDQIGEYGIAYYTIDFDNQPSGAKYYKATDVLFAPINSSAYLQMRSGDMVSDRSNDPITSAGLYANTLLNGYCFMSMTKTNAPGDRTYEYELIYNTDSTTKYERPRLYLKTEITSQGSSSTTTQYFLAAIDMSSLMYSSYVKDTIVKDTNYEEYKYKLCWFDLFYQSGEDSEGRPIFSPAKDNPQRIFDVETK